MSHAQSAQRRPTKTFVPEGMKLEGDEGDVEVVFSTLNVVDKDGDVTVPGAFKEGQEVLIMQYGHAWHSLPVGRGTIHEEDGKGVMKGKFFLDTDAGSETYKTIKNTGGLQEWSYGYDIEESKRGQFEDEDVLFLEGLDVFEVSPVMIGAGEGTHTQSIKSVCSDCGGKGDDETTPPPADPPEGEDPPAGDGGDPEGSSDGDEADDPKSGADLLVQFEATKARANGAAW